MTRIMYDAVTVDNMPGNGDLYAGYVDGIYANYAAVVARFPGKIHVPIAVSAGTDSGIVLDVETGDASPDQAPGWVARRRVAGFDPTVYCNYSTWGSVIAAFNNAGIAQPHYWIADYDGNPTIYSGAVAKQYSTGSYDTSSVMDHWPGVDRPIAPKPTTPPPPVPHFVEEEMISYFEVTSGDYYLPLEPAGTVQNPRGGARNGPMWVKVIAQTSGQIGIYARSAGKWNLVTAHTAGAINAGDVWEYGLPTDGSIDSLHFHGTAQLVGYVVGRQVA